MPGPNVTVGAQAEPGIYDRLTIPDEDRSTSISRVEGAFIGAFLTERGLRDTLETGLAYGCSAAHIIAATRSVHVAVDPHQRQNYGGLGIENVARLGLGAYLEHIPEPAHLALPRLLREGRRFSFLFVDGGHRFDDIFVDFYFGDLLLVPGGYILFHDAWMRSTQTVVAFIRTNRRDYRRVSVPCGNLVLVQKVGADTRSWNHFRGFYTTRSLLQHWWFNRWYGVSG